MALQKLPKGTAFIVKPYLDDICLTPSEKEILSEMTSANLISQRKQILKENRSKFTFEDIQIIIRRINRRFCEIPEEELKFLASKMTISEMAKFFYLPYQRIWNHLKRFEIKIKTKKTPKKVEIQSKIQRNKDGSTTFLMATNEDHFRKIENDLLEENLSEDQKQYREEAMQLYKDRNITWQEYRDLITYVSK